MAEKAERARDAARILLRLADEQQRRDIPPDGIQVAQPILAVCPRSRLRLPLEQRLGQREVRILQVLVPHVALVEGGKQEVVAAVANRLDARIEILVKPLTARSGGEGGAQLEVEVAPVNDDGHLRLEEAGMRERVRARFQDRDELPEFLAQRPM